MCVRIQRRNERKEKERRKRRRKREEKRKRRNGREKEKDQRICLQHSHNKEGEIQTNKQICSSLFSLPLSLSLALCASFPPPSCLVLTLFAVFVNSVQFSPLLHPLQPIHSYVNSHGKKGKEYGEKEKGGRTCNPQHTLSKQRSSLSRHTCPFIHCTYTVISLGGR